MKNGRKKPKYNAISYIRLDAKMFEALERMRLKEDRPLAAMLRVLVREAIERRHAEQDTAAA